MHTLGISTGGHGFAEQYGSHSYVTLRGMKRAPLLLGLALAWPHLAGALTVRVLGVSSTQAVLQYTAPDDSPCRVEVSESADYAPLVADVDGSVFPGADRDDRPGALNNGTDRVVVVGRRGMIYTGTKNPFLGADGKRHSRALQTNTTHYYRVTCGQDVSSGTFQTTNIPLGSTYGEQLPPDPLRPGRYNWPDIDASDRNEEIVDPLTGALVRKLTVSADSSGDGNANTWPVGGMFSLCSHVPVTQNGDTYYLCAIPANGAATLISINVATGDAHPLSRVLIPYLQLGNMSQIPCPYPLFDGTNPLVFYFVASLGGKTSVAMGEWRGALDTDYPVPASASTSSPPLKWTNLTPGGNDIPSLLSQFDGRFQVKQQGSFYIDGAGMQDGKLLLRMWANQDASGWVVVFDTGSRQPIGKGGTGGVVAALPVWQAPGSRWCGLHAVYSAGDHGTWVTLVDNPLPGGTAYLAGPYRVQVTGTSGGSIAPGDTVFAIQPQNGRYEPVDPSPGAGEGDGYLMDAQPGDLFFLDRNGDGAYTNGTDEYIELVSKDAADHTWTVRRGAGMAQSPYYAGSGLTPKLKSYPAPAGTYLYAACRTQSLVNPLSATLWWNFAADPHGTNLTPPGVSGLKSAQVIEHVYTGAHEVNRDGTNVMAGGPGKLPVEWSAWTFSQGVPGLDTGSPAISSNARPSFEGASPPGLGNTYQQHPSYEQVNAPAAEKQWFLDVMPLVGGTDSYGKSDLVSGTNSVYKVTGTSLNRDRLPTLATCGTSALEDISSAAQGNGISDDTPYTYCVARKPGECRSDANAGDAYVSCPNANFRLPGDAPRTIRCAGTELTGKTVDICLGDLWTYGQSVVQTGFAQGSPNGEYSRVITQGFDSYHTGIYSNARATPDGGWAMFKSTVTGSLQAYMAKLPPFPAADEVVRDGFIPVRLTLAPPAGAPGVNNAVVKFGYAENGAPEDFYCTTRQEACVKGNQPGSEYGFAGDGVGGMPCANGCTVMLPLIPQRTLYYRAEYRDASNKVVAIGQEGVAGETWSYPEVPRRQAPPGRVKPAPGL